MTAPMTRDARALVLEFWRAGNAREWDAFARVLAPGVEYLVPQTRERVRGRDNYVEFNRTWPGQWQAHIKQLVAEEAKAVSVIDFVVDGQTMVGISAFVVEAGLIAHITDWWPEPYEPPARATDKIERY